MSLSITELVKVRMRDLEFSAPTTIVRGAIRLGLLPKPFTVADDELEAIFIHLPKAAGTSIRRAISGTKSYHIPLSRYWAEDAERTGRYFKFCFVRNPWDRMSSAYHYLKERCVPEPRYPDGRWANRYLSNVADFEDFLGRLRTDQAYCASVMQYKHFRSQLDWLLLPGQEQPVSMDFIGRYENLLDDYAFLGERLPIELTLPSERVGDMNKDYRTKYTNRMKDTVASLYRDDIKYLGYDFE